MEQAPRRKIRVTDRDPYVYQRARAEAARFHLEREKGLQKKRAELRRTPVDIMAGRRRQNMTLGLMFAALAFIIWLGAQIASPKLVVTTHGAQGTVLLDRVEAGRTGTVLQVPAGIHQVTVRFDDARYKPAPSFLPAKTGYSLKPYEIEFHATLPMEMDSTAVGQDPGE